MSSSWSAPKPPSRKTILLVDDDSLQAFARVSALRRRYSSVERAADGAEALVRLDEPGFTQRLALVIVGLHLPGLGGPPFVNELTARVPRNLPVLVIGRAGEIAPDYEGENVRFLPRHASTDDVLAGARAILAEYLPQVA